MKLRIRRSALAALIAGSAALMTTGCTAGGMSLASLNPFSKASDPVAATPPASSTMTGKLAAMRQTATGQVSSVGMATKSAFTKTKNGITGIFGKKSTTDAEGNPIAADDPTRLDTPANVGPDVFVAQGQLWETTGDFQKAMQSYTKALESEPKNAAALASVARLHFRQESYQPASDFFRRAIEQNPNDAGLHNDYGLTQAKLGDMAGATQSINKALSISPGTSRFANNLANVKYDAGDSQGALAVLMQHNKPAVAHFNMAYLHYKAGKLPEAKTHLGEVVKYEPQAASDSAVSKAVTRSKEMLAQIEGPASRIAQAAPQAYAAAGQFVNAFQQPQQPVQQTAQVGATTTAPAVQAGAFAPSATPWMGGTVSGPTPPATSPAQVSAPPTTAAPAGTSPQTPYTLPPGFFNQ
jgi:Flp pilus assembly protein TadD